MSFALFAILGGSLVAVNVFGRPAVKPVAPARNAIIAGVPLDPAPTAAPPAPSPALAAPSVAGPAAVKPAAAPSASAAPRGHATSQRLAVKALERTRFRIQVDDGPPVDAVLAAGAVREWTANRRFRVSVANAAGVEVRLNGRRMPPLGARGTAVRELELPRGASPS